MYNYVWGFNQYMIKLATVFSGIGAVECSLKYLHKPYKLVFACDNGERELKIDYDDLYKLTRNKSDVEIQKIVNEQYKKTGKENLIKKTYFANHKIKNNQWYEDIKFLNAKPFKNKIDLFVGGSPCQSFSSNGKRLGFKDIRGTLFYDFCRIVKEAEPKVFIYENVRGMLNHDKGNTWETIKNVFSQIDYDIYINKVNDKEHPTLNSKDFGIPQNRERIFVVGFKKGLKIKEFKFPSKIKLKKSVYDFLENKIDAKYYLGEKGFKFVTTHPSRARVNCDIIGCQKANQQFNWNGDFIFEPLDKIKHTKEILNNSYIGIWKGKKGVCRKLTPRECLNLMGFNNDFKIVQDDITMYRQTGNSIVVNVLEEIIKEIYKTGVFKNA